MTASQTGQICWTELATPDVNTAKNFYSKLFGWQFSDHQMGEMTYTLIKTNDKEFGGIWAIPQDKQKEIPPHWMAYVLVENVEESLKKVTEHGGKIIKPATKAGDMGIFAIILDPTGAHIALWQNLKK